MVLMWLFCSVSCFLSTVSVQGVVEHRSAGVCQGVLHTDGDRCAVELCSHTASVQQDSSHNPLRETHVLSCLASSTGSCAMRCPLPRCPLWLSCHRHRRPLRCPRRRPPRRGVPTVLPSPQGRGAQRAVQSKLVGTTACLGWAQHSAHTRQDSGRWSEDSGDKGKRTSVQRMSTPLLSTLSALSGDCHCTGWLKAREREDDEQIHPKDRGEHPSDAV